VPFNSSYKPGPKDFDFDVNQISINEQRKRAVDFSEPYYEAPQGVIAPKGSPAADAKSLADLADTEIGV
jgi:polar amino acid transport system substrate-binding protein